MPNSAQTLNPGLEEAIERCIQERTSGRIHQLHVETPANRVVVHGYTSSYYVKQLAIQAVLDVLGARETVPVQMDIQVGEPGPRDSQGQDAPAESS